MDLFTFSVMRLTSNALSSGTSSWSYLRKGTSLSQTSSRSTSPQLLVSSDSLPSGNGNDAGRVIRPLQHNKWSKGKDGFLVTDIWGKDATPTIWLHQRQERVHLLAYQHKCLTLVLLVPTEAIVNGELDISFVKHQVTENVSFPLFHCKIFSGLHLLSLICILPGNCENLESGREAVKRLGR